MFKRAIALAKRLSPPRRSLRDMAEAIRVAPTYEQVRMKQVVEPALDEIARIALRMEELSDEMAAVGIKVSVRPQLRILLDRLFEARKLTAFMVYVETPFDRRTEVALRPTVM